MGPGKAALLARARGAAAIHGGKGRATELAHPGLLSPWPSNTFPRFSHPPPGPSQTPGSVTSLLVTASWHVQAQGVAMVTHVASRTCAPTPTPFTWDMSGASTVSCSVTLWVAIAGVLKAQGRPILTCSALGWLPHAGDHGPPLLPVTSSSVPWIRLSRRASQLSRSVPENADSWPLPYS